MHEKLTASTESQRTLTKEVRKKGIFLFYDRSSLREYRLLIVLLFQDRPLHIISGCLSQSMIIPLPSALINLMYCLN